jgi:hypothetical protein
MTPGEMAVPPQIQTPQVMTALNRAFATQGASAAQYTAGSPAQGVNPSTGMPEFQMVTDDPDAPNPYGATSPYAAQPQQQLTTAPIDPYAGDLPGVSTQDLKSYRPHQFNLQQLRDAQKPPPMPYDPQQATPGESSAMTYGTGPEAPQPPATYLGILGRGILRGSENVQQSAQTVSGGTPTESQTPQADYEQPTTLSDLWHPSTLLDKTLFQFAKSYPTIAGTVLAGGAGMAAGAAIPGAGETGTSEVAGGLIGAAAGAGLTSAFQALGPIYAAELKKNPNNPDMAFDAALKQAGEEGAIGAVAQAAFGFAPFKSVIKNVFMQAGLVQPGIAATGTALQDVSQGKTAAEIGSDVTSAAIGAVTGTAAGEAAHAGYRYVGGKLVPNTADNTPPVDPANTAALTLALPAPGPGNRPDVINVPPTGPGQVSGSDIVPSYPPAPTPPAPPQLPPPGTGNRPDVVNVPPGPGQVSPTEMAPGPTPYEPPAQPTGSPPGVPPLPPDQAPPPAQPALPPPSPQTAPPVIQAPDLSLAAVRAGQRPDVRGGPDVPPGEPPPPPPTDAGGEPPSPPPPAPPTAGGPGGGAGATVATPEGFTVEPDHTGPPGAVVVKNTDGNVIAVGDTPEQALAFARQRAPGVQLASAEGAPAEAVTPSSAVEPAGERAPAQPTVSPPQGAAPETPGVTPGKEPSEPKQIPSKPLGEHYSVRQNDDGTVAADMTNAKTGKTTGKFVADDGTIADAGSGKEAWKAPNDAAQQRAAELLEQAVRRNYPQRITDLLQKHVEGYEGPPSVEAAKAGGPTVGEQLKARQAKKTQPAPKRGNVFVAEPTPEQEPPVPARGRSSGMADEARAEAEGLASSARLEPGTVPVKGEEAPRAAAAGIPELATAEGVGERSEQTTNKTRFAKDYLDQVLSGEMTPEEAHATYGEQPAGAGRPRLHATFRDYVQNVLDKMTAPGQSLPERIASVQRAAEAGELTGRKRSAAEREINRSDVMKYTESGLRDIIDRLPDPAEERAAAEQRMLDEFAKFGDTERSEAGTTTEPAPEHPAVSARRPEVNAPVRAIFDRIANGERVGAHEVLDAITGHTGPRAITPDLVALARRLRRILPDIPFQATKAGDTAAGAYYPGRDAIEVNTKYGTPEDIARLQAGGRVRSQSNIETALHELVHGATDHYLRRLESKPPETLSPLERSHIRALDAIHSELGRIAASDKLTSTERHWLNYAMQNRRELVSMLMTNPSLKAVLARNEASPILRNALSREGFGPAKGITNAWEGFKTWVGRIFGLKNASVLDRVLDPTTQVVGTGALYRDIHARDLGITESGAVGSHLESHTEDLNRVAVDDPLMAPSEATAAGRKILRDFASRPLFRGALNVANLDAIHSFGRRLFESRDKEAPGNSLTDYRTAVEARAAATKDERDKYGNFIQRMVGRLREGADGAKVAQLMNDATLAEARLGDRDPRANAHLTTEESQARLKQLNDRYEALGQRGQETYRNLRDYYRETYNAERRAELDHAMQSFLPDSTPAQRASITGEVRTREGIQKMIDDPDASPVAQAFGERWQNSRNVVREIGRLQRAGYVRGDYFPLRRYGDYIVRYGERGGPRYGVEFFERESQAQARRQELLNSEGYKEEEVSRVFLRSQQDQVRNSAGSLGQLSDAFDRAGLTEAQRNRALDAYAEMQLRAGTRNQSNALRARREGVLGASTDQARNLANDFLAYSARMGWLKHGATQVNALDAMDRHLDGMRRSGDTVNSADLQRAGMIRDEMRNRLRPVDNSGGILGRAPHALSTFSFIMNLMRPAHMVVQLADAHSNATSLMGARHGFGAASVSLGKAVRDLAGTALSTGGRNAMKAIKQEIQNSDWNTSALYRDRMVQRGMPEAHANQLMNALNAAGLVDHSMVREIQRMASDSGSFDFGGKYGKAVGLPAGVMNMFAAGEHAVDSMNRTAIAKAAFDLEMRKSNGDVGKAVDYAVQTAREAMPNYNLHNRPSLVGKLGALGGPILQYKLYGMHMYSLMGNLAHDIYTGGGRGRSEAVKALGAILTSHALLSGVTASVFGSLPLAVGLGLYDLFSGDQKPHTSADLENAVRNWTRDHYGKTASEVIARGLPTLARVDLHRSLKLANAVDLPEITSFKSKDLMATLGAAMTGAAGDNLTQVASGLSQILNGGNWGKAAESLMPRPVHDVMQAYRFYNQGVTDTQGRQILPPVSAYDAVAKGLGFNPSDVSSGREARQAEIDLRDETLEGRSRAMNAYLNADPKDRGAAMTMIWQYNRDHPSTPITMPQIKDALTQRQRAVMTPGTYGLRVPPKQLRDMQQAGRFAQ